MVKSTMTGTVTSSGRGGTAAAMAQNEHCFVYCFNRADVSHTMLLFFALEVFVRLE